MDAEQKPMLRVDQLVEHMKSKNIKFGYISEEAAEKYLKNNNNYYNLSSYKNIFERFIGGPNDRKFID